VLVLFRTVRKYKFPAGGSFDVVGNCRNTVKGNYASVFAGGRARQSASFLYTLRKHKFLDRRSFDVVRNFRNKV
jgi:hypothetical protein